MRADLSARLATHLDNERRRRGRVPILPPYEGPRGNARQVREKCEDPLSVRANARRRQRKHRFKGRHINDFGLGIQSCLDPGLWKYHMWPHLLREVDSNLMCNQYHTPGST